MSVLPASPSSSPSSLAFFTFLRGLHDDPLTPAYMGQLPACPALVEHAASSTYVFSLEAPAPSPSTRAVKESHIQRRQDLLLAGTTEGWPLYMEDGLPLYEVSSVVLTGPHHTAPSSSLESADAYGSAECSGAMKGRAYTEYMVGSRWELLSTVLAIERYTVLAVPDDEKAAVPPRGESGTNAWAAASQECSGAEANIMHEGSLEARAAEAHGSGAARAGPSAVCPPEPARLTDVLTPFQQRTARVLFTLCRVLTTASGLPPAVSVANARLRALSAPGRAAAPALGSRRAPGCPDTEAALRARFHSFLTTPIPFLGVDANARAARWQSLALQSAIDRCSPSRGLEAVAVAAARHGEASKSAHVDSTFATDTSTASEQGPTCANTTIATIVTEGSRQPSWPTANSLGTAGSGRRAGTASADTSLLSNGSTACAAEPSSGSCRAIPCGLMSFLSPSSMAARSPHFHYRWTALPSLFDESPPYGRALPCPAATRSPLAEPVGLVKGWQQWAVASRDGLSRPLIVNSMDEIVRFCDGSRRAFYSAVELLDLFVTYTASDPSTTCAMFRRYVRLCRADAALAGTAHRATTRASAAQEDRAAALEPVNDRDICAFFTQVICVCCMLGCKAKDRYPPPLPKLLLCLNGGTSDDRSGFGAPAFKLLEMFLLSHVYGFAHLNDGATVNEVADLLMDLVGGDDIESEREAIYYSKRLKHAGVSDNAVRGQVLTRLADSEAGHRRSRQTYLERVTLAAEGVHDGHDGACASASLVSSSGLPPVRGPTREQLMDWQRMACAVAFVSDLVIRGALNNADYVRTHVDDYLRRQERHGVVCPRKEAEMRLNLSRQCCLLRMDTCTLGLAVVAVTASVLRVALPEPIYAVLPPAYQQRLRALGLCPLSAAGRAGAAPSPASSDAARPADNEESLLAAPSTSASPAAAENTHFVRSQGEMAASPSPFYHLSSQNCFPVKQCDDSYLLLTRFCALVATSQQRGDVAAVGGDDDDSDDEQDDNADEEGVSSVRVSRLQVAIEEVHRIVEEAHVDKCDGVLRTRYREMLTTMAGGAQKEDIRR